MARQMRRTPQGLSQYELAAQGRIRQRNAEQAGKIPEPQLPSTGTSRVSALLAEAQRKRDEAWQAQAERQAEEALLFAAQREREEAIRAEAERRAEEALLAEAERRAEEALLAEAQRHRDEDETTPAERFGRGGGSRWSEIVLERRIDLGQNPFRPATYDLDLPSAG
jgi:hypothetical protein